MDEMTGGCHCGKVRYAIAGDPLHVAVCHCSDCRRSAGATPVAWLAVKTDAFRVTEGEPARYSSNGQSERYFCPGCGTGLYFVNEAALPGLVDIQAATLDDPEAHAPQVQIQTAEKLAWTDTVRDLPAFERYPG